RRRRGMGRAGGPRGWAPRETGAGGGLPGAGGRHFAVVTRADRISSRHVIQVRDAMTGAQFGQTLTCDSRGGVLALAPDGDTVAVADGGVCRLWSAKAGTAAGEPLSQPDDITAMVFLGDGGRLLTGSQEGLLRVWDVASRLRLGPPLTHGSPIRHLSPRPDGRTVLVEGVELSRAWDL